MRRACIDIGSNTTRLLVAECHGDRLEAIHQERVFTHIGRTLRYGTIGQAKIAEVTSVVSAQLEVAHGLGAREVAAVATAAIRRARNGSALVSAIGAACGLVVRILSGEEEARLAFRGAAGTLERASAEELGVVDVGGGSSELVVGKAPDEVSWSASFALGSGDLADGCFRSDPPSADDMRKARDHVAEAVRGLTVPKPRRAVAVGGSAASLRSLAGPLLDGDAFKRSLSLLTDTRAVEVAASFGLDVQRVRLLPAGLLILEAASQLFGTVLEVGRGGLREGVLLDAASSASPPR